MRISLILCFFLIFAGQNCVCFASTGDSTAGLNSSLKTAYSELVAACVELGCSVKVVDTPKVTLTNEQRRSLDELDEQLREGE